MTPGKEVVEVEEVGEDSQFLHLGIWTFYTAKEPQNAKMSCTDD